MSHILKNTAKFAIGICVTLGAVAVAASVVASRNIGKIIPAGFKDTNNTAAEEFPARNTDTDSTEAGTMFADTEEVPAAQAETASADIEN